MRFIKPLAMILLTVSSLTIFAQAPQALNYQAVARNSTGAILSNQNINLQISVLDGSASGTAQYVERQSTTTNQFGLFSIAIGQGSTVSGTFVSITWGSASKYLKVEMDPAGGNNFVVMGTSQLLSVPYALYADVSKTTTITTNATLTGAGTTASPLGIAQQGATTGQVLQWNGSNWLPATIITTDTWGSQVAITTSRLTGDGTAGNPLDIAQQGATIGQALVWNGTTWAPGTISGSDNWGTQVAITNLTLSGNGTAGSPLGLASQSATLGQVLGWNGSAWAPITLSGSGPGDNWGAQVAQTNATLSGNGTAGNPLALAQQGATSGQTLKWNGATWAPAADNDAQTLNLAGTTLSITNGNSVTLPAGGTYTGGTGINVTGTVITNTGDTNPLDDITTSTTAGGDLNGLYPNPTVDGLQGFAVANTAPASGQVLTWNGISWAPATPSTGTTYTSGTGINIAGNVISNTGDLSATNELQTLSIVGNTLSISSGNSVTIPSTGGGTYTGGTGITISGTNVINSNWTASGSDIYNNNAGKVTIGSATPPSVNATFGVTALTGNSQGAYVSQTNSSTTNTWSLYAANTGSGTGNPIAIVGDATSTGGGNALGIAAFGDSRAASFQADGGAGFDALLTIFGANESYGSWSQGGGATTTATVWHGAINLSESTSTTLTNTEFIGSTNIGHANATGSIAIGAYGLADAGSGNFGVGVYGDTITLGGVPTLGNFAGYFNGDVSIVGNLSKGSGTFKIDHPLDPANKYLIHSFVESPDMMNIYNGNITTDANGDATVNLPSYFNAENIDFKYQLTVIGQFAQAIVAEEVAGNQFKIKTDKPNVKVSWQVTGVRNDAYAQQHRIVAEVNKKGPEIGRYLYPREMGQPSSLSISNLFVDKSKMAKGTTLANGSTGIEHIKR